MWLPAAEERGTLEERTVEICGRCLGVVQSANSENVVAIPLHEAHPSALIFYRIFSSGKSSARIKNMLRLVALDRWHVPESYNYSQMGERSSQKDHGRWRLQANPL